MWTMNGSAVITVACLSQALLIKMDLYGLKIVKMLKLEQTVRCLFLAGYYVTGNEGMFNPIFLYPLTIYKLDAEHCLGLA
jgi:hypothetical protein